MLPDRAVRRKQCEVCYPSRVSLAAYVHFPWCLQRCPYCDFATDAIAPRDIPHVAYGDAVLHELDRRADSFRGPLGTIFFGGGTPSLWAIDQLGRVIRALTERFGAAEEITVECNPTSLDRDRALAMREVGVTRVSIGVQSLRDQHLRYLGRLHDADGARHAIREAVRAGGLRVSADLMFGMTEQRADALVDDARELLDLGVEHVSAYALTIEPATRFGELARKGRLPRLPDDDVAVLYEALERVFGDAGWTHYEVSNYARPGAEARHNVAYWRGADYVGLGTGAVGCHSASAGGALRYRTLHDVPAYFAARESRGEIPDEREALDGQTLVREGLMLGLRTTLGVDLAALATRSGVDPRAGRETAIARAISRGDVVEEGNVLRIPSGRWLLADDIVARLF